MPSIRSDRHGNAILDGDVDLKTGKTIRINGQDALIPVDLNGVADGDGLVYSEDEGKFLPGAASGGGGTAVLTAVLQSDFLDDTGELTPVSDLTVNLIAGHWYRINGLVGEVYGDSVGFNFDLDGGTATVTAIRGYYSGVVEDPVQEQITDLATNLLHGTSAGGYFQFDVVLQVNAGGTFIPRFAQNVPDPTPSLLRKGCAVTAIDVTPGS